MNPDPQAYELLQKAFGVKVAQEIVYETSVSSCPSISLAILLGIKRLKDRIEALEAQENKENK